MANITDLIESFILSEIGDELKLRLSRNELANHFSCAPSQINYVLSTRFTPDKGYIIESKRGGGGSITVFKVQKDRMDLLNDLSYALGNNNFINENKAFAVLERLACDEIIDVENADIIATCLSDRALSNSNNPQLIRRDMLIEVLKQLMKG